MLTSTKITQECLSREKTSRLKQVRLTLTSDDKSIYPLYVTLHSTGGVRSLGTATEMGTLTWQTTRDRIVIM